MPTREDQRIFWKYISLLEIVHLSICCISVYMVQRNTTSLQLTIMAESLDDDQVAMLRRAFSMFDSGKVGKIEKEKVRTILNTLGHTYNDSELDALLEGEDQGGTGKLSFDSFCRVAVHFLDEDDEALQKELKEAFRLYDKEGNGYIPISSLREILAALDDQLTPDQLNEMIAEIDTDDSGTVDFDEFMEMMTGD